MTYPAARKGDNANHKGQPPGAILEGSSNVTTNNKPAARMGDLVKHGGGEEPIVQGSGSVTINGLCCTNPTHGLIGSRHDG